MEPRKHRFTLLLGYGEEAGSLLKRFEQAKFHLEINTNILFLTFLLDFYEQHQSKDKQIEKEDVIISENMKIHNQDKKLSLVSVGTDEKNSSNSCPSEQTISELEPELCLSTLDVPVDTLSQTEILKNIQGEEKECFLKEGAIRNGELENEIEKMSSVYSPSSSKYQKTSFGLNGNDGKRRCSVPVNKNKDCSFSDSTSDINNEEDNATAIEIISRYLEHAKRETSYYHGYVSSGQKLREFLDEYRTSTNMCFTVRSSRSYLKKRALSSAQKKSNNINEDQLLLGATQTLDNDAELLLEATNTSVGPDEGIAEEKEHYEEFSETFNNENKTANQNNKENTSINILDEFSIMDSIIAGPLRWEYVLGRPAIPFTGVPFCIIGNTQYQCFYTCADSRSQKRKADASEEDVKSNQPSKIRRARRSLKRDCKAIMCIKSIVSFPEFTVEETIAHITSKKGCRRLKAETLEKVRKAFVSGETVGRPAFWVCVPLPEAHSTHDQKDTSSNQKDGDTEPPLGEMDAIAQLLNLAAQYGGKVQILQKGEENIIEFNLKKTCEKEGDVIAKNEDDTTDDRVLTFKEEEVSP